MSDRGMQEVGGSEGHLVFKSGFSGFLTEAVASNEPLSFKFFSGLLTGVIGLPSRFCLVCLLPDASLCFSGLSK